VIALSTALEHALGQGAADEGLRQLLRGIEKESLRVDGDSRLASTPHPVCLGSPLTHPSITTDFSEAQLELITGVSPSAADTLAQLQATHRFVVHCLGEERLWASSMPGRLPEDSAIPVGRYGTSNVGMAKTVYRRGLGLRYGRTMQTISGIHYNFSLSEALWQWLGEQEGEGTPSQAYRTRRYFDLIRNFRRHSWLLLYLFGASPAVFEGFLQGRPHQLEKRGKDTLLLPHATTLRMGGLGYQSDAQATLKVSYNGLAPYAQTLQGALTRPYGPYEAFGLEQNGEFVQLSTSLLQIENEFYGTIRPKRSIHPGERALHALGERGVEYVEVRCLDLNPFLPLGIDAPTIHFLDTFLLLCLLLPSPEDSPAEIDQLAHMHRAVVERGRDPALRLTTAAGEGSLATLGAPLLAAAAPIAEALDRSQGTTAHREALARAAQTLSDPDRTPSAAVLAEMGREGDSFLALTQALSDQHRETLRSLPLSAEEEAAQAAVAKESHAAQKAIEAQDRESFAAYRKAYMEQPLLPPHGTA